MLRVFIQCSFQSQKLHQRWLQEAWGRRTVGVGAEEVAGGALHPTLFLCHLLHKANADSAEAADACWPCSRAGLGGAAHSRTSPACFAKAKTLTAVSPFPGPCTISCQRRVLFRALMAQVVLFCLWLCFYFEFFFSSGQKINPSTSSMLGSVSSDLLSC